MVHLFTPAGWSTLTRGEKAAVLYSAALSTSMAITLYILVDGLSGLVGGALWLLLGLLEAVHQGESYLTAHRIARVTLSRLDKDGLPARWESKSHCGCIIAWEYDSSERRWTAVGVIDAAPECKAQFVS